MDYLLIILIIIIPLIAQLKISLNYKRFSIVTNINGKTGYDIAKEILNRNNLNNIDVIEVPGELTDHYDSKAQVIRLSSSIYHGTSISSTAVAAHECGHAIQDKEGYNPMRLRAMIFPIVNIATTLSYWIILLGFIFQLINLVYIGIIFTCFGLIFQIITLPVEFDASKRAKEMLISYNLVNNNEIKGIKKVLNAAAMTYVAGVLSSALQILRLLLIAQDRK